jgi:hypothetical protein
MRAGRLEPQLEGIAMRRLTSFAATVLGLYLAARWWRQHRRVGTDFVNRSVNPWLERHGFISGSARRARLDRARGAQVRRGSPYTDPPMPTADGFRIIVPVGEECQWARNVLAAGHCSLITGDRRYELDEPKFETPAEVPDLPRPGRILFGWPGFRYLRMRTFTEVEAGTPTPVSATGPGRCLISPSSPLPETASSCTTSRSARRSKPRSAAKAP